MCGISLAFGTHAAQRAMTQYDFQKSRGSDGFGFVALQGTHFLGVHRATTEKQIRKKLAEIIKHKPTAILFHHRFPTSVPNYTQTAHPILIRKDEWQHDYYLIHNGVIAHTDAEVDEIRKQGYAFSTEVTTSRLHTTADGMQYIFDDEKEVNDSEVLGYHLAMFIETGSATNMPGGSKAFCMVQVTKKTQAARVYIGRNYANPLKCKAQKNGVLYASEAAGGVDVEVNKLFELDTDGAVQHVSELHMYPAVTTQALPSYNYGRARDYDDIEEYEHAHSFGFHVPQKYVKKPSEFDILAPDEHDRVVKELAKIEAEIEDLVSKDVPSNEDWKKLQKLEARQVSLEALLK